MYCNSGQSPQFCTFLQVTIDILQSCSCYTSLLQCLMLATSLSRESSLIPPVTPNRPPEFRAWSMKWSFPSFVFFFYQASSHNDSVSPRSDTTQFHHWSKIQIRYVVTNSHPVIEKWHLSCMNGLMNGWIILVCKSLTAYCTSKWFSPVWKHMRLLD